MSAMEVNMAKNDDYEVLEGLYELDKTIGRGGFAKVKKATHKLTGERVAIKILDKKSLGEDLPRVYREIDTLKNLCHPHICKLYQVIYTENKIFMIMEYCRGGELFDYIVERDRLDEIEGKRIFRQIASAVNYIHHGGIAHRDLKPENILLDENNNVKLIDFGLCAVPKGGIKCELDTCCGSPAYASPELVKGEKYIGPQTDVWSLGVLLYALLNGFLPFDDPNLNNLYRKIQAGVYDEPRWLSEGSKNILRCMLRVNPKLRLTVDELLNHTWCATNQSHNELSIQSMKEWDGKFIDMDVVSKMGQYYRKPLHQIEAVLSQWNYKYYETATYFLLLQRKKKYGTRYLIESSINPYRIISMKIQKSLESDFLECEDNNDLSEYPSSTPIGHQNHRSSMEGGLDDCALLQIGSPKMDEDKENSLTLMKSPARKIPAHEFHDFVIPKISNSTPKRPSRIPDPSPLTMSMKNSFSPSSRSADSILDNMKTPLRDRIKGFGYSPMPSSSPRSKVLGSIERGLDKMRNILTPSKNKKNKIKTLPYRNMGSITVSTTESNDPDSVLFELKASLTKIGVICKQRGYRLIGEMGRLKIELQIIKIENSNLIGIQRKRICGESIDYKRVIERVLGLTGIGLSKLPMMPPQTPQTQTPQKLPLLQTMV